MKNRPMVNKKIHMKNSNKKNVIYVGKEAILKENVQKGIVMILTW
jgi:hypothetical protein